MDAVIRFLKSKVRFDRNELSGAFGDIGTDLPLILGMIMVTGIDGLTVLVIYGIMQILTALIYGIPMPVQPLKMVAILVITQKIAPGVLYGGGLAIGVIMLILTFAGFLDKLARLIPLAVVRGVQMALGLQLGMLALKEYIPAEAAGGYVLAGAAFAIVLVLIGNRRFPPALAVILLGVVYGLIFKWDAAMSFGLSGIHLPAFRTPQLDGILTGLVVLAIPQIPLSLGNSIFASHQAVADYFPDKNVPVRKIGLTYSLLNIAGPFFGGIPVCHGSGGLAGHYAFGARTGGSVVIYGLLLIGMGLLFGGNVNALAALFPKPVLGVVLVFEGLCLLNLVKDTVSGKNEFTVMLLVALAAISLPYGYLIGMAGGTLIHIFWRERAIGIPESFQTELLEKHRSLQ